MDAKVPVDLSELLRAKGLTQFQLAVQAGVTITTIQNILYRRTPNPGLVTCQKIADILGCTLDDMIPPEKES